MEQERDPTPTHLRPAASQEIGTFLFVFYLNQIDMQTADDINSKFQEFVREMTSDTGRFSGISLTYMGKR